MWLLPTLILYLSVEIVKSTVYYLQHPVKSCHIGDTVENECNKCLCTSKTVFECTPLDCNRKATNKEPETIKPVCFPNQLYVQNLITCICTKDGRWPHKSCHDIFQSLPSKNVITHKCQPDTYVPIDCNICRCGPNGEIINDRCTRNACEDEIHRRVQYTYTVYSKCEINYWYSLAPCQFCVCVTRNKLVCNLGSYYTKNLDPNSTDLKKCGKELIKEATELVIPDNQRMLRMGGFDLTNISTTPIQKAEYITDSNSNEFDDNMSEDNYLAIEVNRKGNDNEPQSDTQIKLDNTIRSNKYYSVDSKEEVQKKQAPSEFSLKRTVKTAVQKMRTEESKPKGPPSIMLPIEGDEMFDESEVKTVKVVDRDFNDIEVKLDQVFTTDASRAESNKKAVQELAKGMKFAEAYQYDGKSLRINLPEALKKVFQLALRKSMLSLTNRTKCTPGDTTAHDCNMCFCLKNSKLLCTNNKCIGGKKASRNRS